MIRPFTCVCFLLACGSGLYLYQAKHRVQTIDREIEKAVRATSELREQTRVLHAEWTLQSDPQRLQALADQLLSLKTVTPGQFTSMADLDGRLPAVRGPESPPSEPLTVPIADGSQPEEPAAHSAASAEARQPWRSPSRRHRRVLPNTSRRPVRSSPRLSRCAPPPVVARPVSVAEPPRRHRSSARVRCLRPRRSSGSALGMARSASLPPPRPMPVSASQWVIQRGRRLGHERRSARRIPRRAARRRSASAQRARTPCRAWRRCGSPQPDLQRRGALEKTRDRLVYTAFGFGLLFLAVIGKLADATILQPLAPHRPERPIAGAVHRTEDAGGDVARRSAR